MSDLICKIEIPKYLRKIQLSKERKKKFYELGKKVPDKYLNNPKYEWKRIQVGKSLKNYLYNKEENELVCSNPRVAGTPKFQVISSQHLYSGTMMPMIRAKVMKELKSHVKSHIPDLKLITSYPLKIHIEFHDVVYESGRLWDLDNRTYVYMKAIQDVLAGNDGSDEGCDKIIEEDNILIITETRSKFIPIDDTENRKLVIYLYKEDDKRILNNKEYKS